jgi:hypothetical protein
MVKPSKSFLPFQAGFSILGRPFFQDKHVMMIGQNPYLWCLFCLCKMSVYEQEKNERNL